MMNKNGFNGGIWAFQCVAASLKRPADWTVEDPASSLIFLYLLTYLETIWELYCRVISCKQGLKMYINAPMYYV